MKLSPRLILSFLRANPTLEWSTTKQDKPFTVKTKGDLIVFHISTGNERSVNYEYLLKFCERFNETASLRPVDYSDISRHSSYLVAIVQNLFRDGSTHTIIATDLDAPSPDRTLAWIYRIVRDTEKARSIKSLHRNECQLCNETIELLDGSRYSEAHHIQPLGGEHRGPDTEDNMICVCPNCHAKCDLGIIRLDRDSIRTVEKHQISDVAIEYHNREIYRGN